MRIVDAGISDDEDFIVIYKDISSRMNDVCIKGRENVGTNHLPIELLMLIRMGNMCSDYTHMVTYIPIVLSTYQGLV
jgi:hypothetical protein